MTSPWLAYNDLAWTEDWVADPADYEDEVAACVDLIRRHAAAPPPLTLLHLGCGAGGHDAVFKRHFTVTGVDLSPGMLALARDAHPEIEYLEDDMRTLRLPQQFDAVAIPDSIDYMVSETDLRGAIATAAVHLRPGGVLLVVGKTAETFRNNTFAYTGAKDEVHITLFEENYVPPDRPSTYEATLVYLIRREGELRIVSETHVLGLFPQATWERVFADAHLSLQIVRQADLDHLYDRALLGDGEYPLTVFIGTKP